MKRKLLVTVDEALHRFLDSRPGRTRSEKLERLLVLAMQMEEERGLRRELSRYCEHKADIMEREEWERTVAEAMWTE